MFNNGVTHDVAKDDYNAVGVLLKWLSYMPKVRRCHKGPFYGHKLDT